jgi:hypothetical protein
MKSLFDRCRYGMFLSVFSACLLLSISIKAQQVKPGTIDRKALVNRHDIIIKGTKMSGPTQVGNGSIAYNFDATGMQSFSDKYPTLSHWGWNSTQPPAGLTASSFKKTLLDTHGRMVPYEMEDSNQAAMGKWLASNPHRFNLARIGMQIKKADGTVAQVKDFENATQHLNLWTGIAESNFTVEGEAVKVITACDGNKDIIGFRIESDLVKQGRLSLFIDFPYGNLNIFSNASDYNKPTAHKTWLTNTSKNSVLFDRQLDSISYQVACQWTGNSTVAKQKEHRYTISPDNTSETVEYVFDLSQTKINYQLPNFTQITANSTAHWLKFWKSGAAIDLSASKDQRWFELERRIVLSQYDMAVNASGKYPPQETGLVSNTWFGRAHYEMYWWHAAHYALWNRWPELNNSLHVYQDNLKYTEKRAKLQGYLGARWPKCPNLFNGEEWPDGKNHAFLVWQQPHPIFFAELDYKAHPTTATLKKWDNVVEQTANFLATYAFFDKSRKEYVLGPPIRVVSENNDIFTTENPTFDLSYWRFGLQVAQQWRKRLKLKPKPEWDMVLKGLSPLPGKDGLYEQWENMEDMWTKFNYEHPALTGVYGVLPGNGVDLATMERTYQKVQATWIWDKCWGWDFPMVAMCAARLGHPQDAVNMLLHPSPKFGYDEHGFVGGGNPYPYFPSNGGLLYAVAMMTAGWNGDKNVKQPGWPKDGSWVVKWEGLSKAL